MRQWKNLQAIDLENIFVKYKEEIKTALTIRLVETELLHLFSKGKLNGTVHTCVGQEFTGVFINKYLSEKDLIVTNHRGHGHYLSKFDDVEGLIAEIMGKTNGASGGFGGSQHLINTNFLSNGIQGGMVPIAAGTAFYNKKNNNGAIAVSFIGDGTLGEGIIYEAFNLATTMEIPLLVVLENNFYAQSTSGKQTFGGSLKERTEGFGLKYFKTNTWDISTLDQTAQQAIQYVQKEGKPAFIEIETYRLNSHSKGDDNRSDNEIKEFIEHDVLNQIIKLGNKEVDDFINNTKLKIEAISLANESKPTLTKYNHNSDHLLSSNSHISYSPNIEKHDRYNTLIYNALKELLTEHNDLIIIGEDIENKSSFTEKEYGGAFKVTKDLSDVYKGRVINTPISEAAFTSLAAGYALNGGRTVVEIMFGDFTTLLFDQILQHISKFELMYNGKVKCPLIIRTPMGGKRGYGPTHSQSIEKHFIGIPNFGVVALHHRISPSYIYHAICNVEGTPFMVIENKILYTIDTSKKQLAGYTYNFNQKLFPDLIITPTEDKPITTIICYGEVLNELEDALYELLIEEEIFVEVICPTLISHIDITTISNSVKKTNNLIIIEEGSNIASWGSEVVTKLVEQSIKIENLIRFSNNNLIPSSFQAEIELLPTKKNIKNIIHQMNKKICL